MISSLSDKHNIPESSLRRNVDVLKDLGLLTCGNSKNKGIPVRLTSLGEMVIEILGGERDE